MKKIFLLLAVVGLISFSACDNDDDVVVTGDGNTISETIDLNHVNLTFDNNTGRYSLVYPLNPNIYDTDVVLVYRRTVDDGFTVWQQIPRTLYLGGGDEVDYDFNFRATDVLIYADATFDLSTDPQFINNQDFRIVIVPSDYAAGLDTADYNAVAKKLHIKESDVKKQ